MTLNETIDKYKMFVENCQKRINHSSKMGYKDKEIYTEWKDEYQQMIDWLEELKNYKDSQPCEDCISRAEAINALDEHKYSNEFCKEHNIDWSVNLGMVHILLNELPSVMPQPRPNGEWIFTTEGNTDHITCSVCGRDSISNFDYCPNCGARMIERNLS